MITNSMSCSFFVAPNRGAILIDALKSLLACTLIPNKISCYFNPVIKSDELEKAIDFCSSNGIDVHESREYIPIGKLFNDSILKSNSEFHLICNDDIVFKDPKSIELILEKHYEGHHLVKGTEAFSAFSISKRLVNTVGYFDENFVWAWEDADYRLRMIKFGVEPYEIYPQPIIHLRCSADRNEEAWEKSSEYFFKKWDIARLLVELKMMPNERELNSEERRYLLYNGFFGDSFYRDLSGKVKLRRCTI